MTKEEFIGKYPATLASYKVIIDGKFSKYKRLNPPELDKLALHFLGRLIDLFRKEVDEFIGWTFEDRSVISKNQYFDTSDQSIKIFKILLIEYREELINKEFPELFDN